MPCRFAFASVAILFFGASLANAQVYVRAPFVRVQVGGPGVSVQAPFVNLNVPRISGYYVPGPVVVQTPGFYYSSPGYVYPPPPVMYPAPGFPQAVPSVPGVPSLPPSVRVQPPVSPSPLPQPSIPPVPPVVPQVAPNPQKDDGPTPLQPTRVLSLEEFAKTFQPRAGTYEIVLMSPVTNEPVTVNFSLPEGTPNRVTLNRNQIEFHYGVRRFVRIEFDRDGAMVSSRL